MNLSEYKNIYKNEESHFFYRSTHNLVLLLIKKYAPNSKNLKILDAGCGTGLLAKKMQKYGEVFGVDIEKVAIKFARKRKVNAKIGSLTKLPFKNQSFDLVTCIDVLYHQKVKKDSRALKELKRVLKKDGILILRVSAHQSLKTTHDTHVHLKYRSSKDGLQKILLENRFKILMLSYVHLPGLPLDFLKARYEHLFKQKASSSAIFTLPSPINSLITRILLLENQIILNFNVPQGIALIAVCKK